MNRFIMGRIGLFTLLAALVAAGCAVEQTSPDEDENVEQTGSDGLGRIGTGIDDQVSAAERPTFKRSSDPTKTPDDEHCAGCGPLPDPWKMGPLPDPWSSSSSSSSSGGSTSSSSGSTTSSGGSTSSGGNKN